MATISCLSPATRWSLLLTVAALVLVLSHGVHAHGGYRAELSSSFYDSSCPSTRDIVRRVIQDARVTDARIPASLIRLHFHDCFANGCDGSLLLDDDISSRIVSEKKAPGNYKSARGFNMVDNIKRSLEKACPGIVSCADILTLAAEISVELAGGPSWSVPLGRRDSTKTNIDSANDLPSPFDPLDILQEKFKNMGLNDIDLVALQGAHTFRRTQCQFTQRNCTARQDEGTLVNLDAVTPDVFDNKYYGNLLRGSAPLSSDQVMLSDPVAATTTAQIVRRFSDNQKDFFRNFVTSMIKMGNISPLTGRDGEIRKNCHRVNKKYY
ncbi:peroxidase 2-like [Lolium rigidum]|uniref:peroxidase 2-like n=1 Tax=Lolium rigidum TaxID=89674 RepID=UPI001F5C4C9A|nr:peroxidase 2-like [Lolium rigidum]